MARSLHVVPALSIDPSLRVAALEEDEVTAYLAFRLDQDAAPVRRRLAQGQACRDSREQGWLSAARESRHQARGVIGYVASAPGGGISDALGDGQARVSRERSAPASVSPFREAPTVYGR